MHPSALDNGQRFFSTYLSEPRLNGEHVVLDVGSQDVNGSLRSVTPAHCRYIGVDFAAGAGVDVVLQDPYRLPFPDGSVDAVVSSSCFEHIEFFWLMFIEVLRVLKPHGLFYLNAPSNGDYHRYPVDCWRFYPDAGPALVHWGQRQGFKPVLLESFTTYQQHDIWNDYVAVFVQHESGTQAHPLRMLHRTDRYMNGRLHGQSAMQKPQAASEDLVRWRQLTGMTYPPPLP
jgi:SAM-dependent methyltransferase